MTRRVWTLRCSAVDGGAGVCSCVNLGAMGPKSGTPGISNMDSGSDYGWVKTVYVRFCLVDF